MAVEQNKVMRAIATSRSRISSSYQKNVFSQLRALETSKQTSALCHVFQAVHTMQLEQPNAAHQVRAIVGARHERTLLPVTCMRLLGPDAAVQPSNGKELLSVSGLLLIPSWEQCLGSQLRMESNYHDERI